MDFNPQYQRLALHGIWIERAGQRRQVLDASQVRVLQREEALERRLYDGRLTAVVFLRDVRVGDVVESAYTVTGANPVTGGHLDVAFPFGWSVPVERRVVRVLTPAGRTLAERRHALAVEAEVTRRGAWEERRWDLRRLPAPVDEEDRPVEANPFPEVRLTEWRDWREVVEWALPLYAAPPPSPAMAELLGRWRALPGDEARLLAALRFAQDEVRYLGIELGDGSHRPTPPGRGAGPPLRRLQGQVAAAGDPAAGPRAGGGAGARLHRAARASWRPTCPSPHAFDHVIVRATVAGREVWLESDPLAGAVPAGGAPAAPFRKALILAPGQAALTDLPEPAPTPSRRRW